jgi:hypothetical protein
MKLLFLKLAVTQTSNLSRGPFRLKSPDSGVGLGVGL